MSSSSSDVLIRKNRVTFRDIARESGVSVASVTHAFRGNTHVSAEKRAVILEAAEKLGYRPHPMVAALMSEVRRKRVAEDQPVLAIVDFFSGSGLMRHTSRRLILQGARKRAEELGHRLDLFEPAEQGMEPASLGRMLYARNILGIVVPPLPGEEILPEGVPWEKFCVVTAGFSCQRTGFHSVVADHFAVINLALQELIQQGHQKIGLYISQDIDHRVCHAWSSAYYHWAIHSKLSPTKYCHFYAEAPTQEGFWHWVENKQPDAVIVDFIVDLKQAKARPKCGPQTEIVTLIRHPDYHHMSGVDQNYFSIGSAAIDLLTSHLYRNEIGPPEFPKKVLIAPKWVKASD